MPQLKTEIAVSALMRRAQSAGAFALIVRKGDGDAGAYIVITHLARDKSFVIYRPIRNSSGERVWWPKRGLCQSDVDLYINRRIDEDPDIWVVEIEDAQGRHFLVEPIEEDAASNMTEDDEVLKSAIKAVFPDR
ncbi:MAG: DUF1491 family protein [Litorimonas sp.]